MTSSLPSNYPEDFIISKGIPNFHSGLWASMIKGRSAGLRGADIKKIEHYKCTDGFEHEFLAIHIDHPLNGIANRKIVLFVERTVTPRSLADLLGISSSTSPAPIPATDLISISVPSVLDPIDHINKHHTTHVLIATLEFNNITPTDTDLSNLLDFVAAKHPHYDLKFQCYWLASFLYDAFQDLFKGKSNDTEHVNKRGRFGKVLAPSKDRWEDLKSEFKTWTRASNHPIL